MSKKIFFRRELFPVVLSFAVVIILLLLLRVQIYEGFLALLWDAGRAWQGQDLPSGIQR